MPVGQGGREKKGELGGMWKRVAKYETQFAEFVDEKASHV